MSLAYIPPGVTVQELTSPSITPLLALAGSICLVGPASGAITRTDIVVLTGTTAVRLPGVPRDANGNMVATLSSSAVSLVIDAINPSIAPEGYSSTTDYTFSNTAGTIVRQVTSQTLASAATSAQATFTLSAGAVPAIGQIVRLTNGTTTEIVTVQSVSGQIVTATTNLQNAYAVSGTTVTWGTIPDGNTVYVTYSYTPSDYFQPIRLNSMADIQNRFGNAWNASNTGINSALSFAASLVFQNGASNVVLQPLYYETSAGVRQQPTDAQAADPTVWANVLSGPRSSLLDLEDINIVVPVVGQSQASVTDALMLQIETATQDFIYQMKANEDRFLIGVLGEDSSGSSSAGQEATLLVHAQTLTPRYAGAVTQQLVFINASRYAMANSTGSFLVGGQYMAAAVAGMLAARSPAAPLTRQAVSGFISVEDPRSKAQKNTDAANGMLVTEGKGGLVVVRHGITMDSTSAATRELNVVRSKHFIIESVRQTLDTQVVGKLIADADAVTTVNNVVIGTLEDLRGLGILVDYGNVESRITTVDPTTMEVRFDYLPAFVINYVNIAFALDLNANTILVTSNGSAS